MSLSKLASNTCSKFTMGFHRIQTFCGIYVTGGDTHEKEGYITRRVLKVFLPFNILHRIDVRISTKTTNPPGHYKNCTMPWQKRSPNDWQSTKATLGKPTCVPLYNSLFKCHYRCGSTTLCWTTVTSRIDSCPLKNVSKTIHSVISSTDVCQADFSIRMTSWKWTQKSIM